jgi:hypothetical protein
MVSEGSDSLRRKACPTRVPSSIARAASSSADSLAPPITSNAQRRHDLIVRFPARADHDCAGVANDAIVRTVAWVKDYQRQSAA